MWYNDFIGGMPLPQCLNKKDLAKFENDLAFRNCFSFLLNQALDLFEWKNLPDSSSERFLEMSLLWRARALITDEAEGYLTLSAANTGAINIYGDPIECYGYGFNGWNKKYKVYIPGSEDTRNVRKSSTGEIVSKSYNAIFIRDNSFQYPYILYIIEAAKRMSDTLRSIDIAMRNMKQSVIITCDESYKKAVEQILNSVDNNQQYILAVKNFDNIEAVDLKPNPEVVRVLWECYDKLDSNFKNILGIDSISNVGKKAQMLSDEVSENNQALEISLKMRLKWRKKACEEFNKMTGLNIDCDIKHKIEQDSFIAEDALTGGNEFDV